MRIFTLLTFALLLALPGFAQDGGDIPAHPDQLKFDSLKFEMPDAAKMRAELSTGTPVYLVEDTALPLVTINVLIQAGSFWEEAGKEGTAVLCASLMRTGGTTRRDPNALDEELDFLAAELSVSFNETNGTATLSVLKKDLEKGLEILFDVLRNPGFDKAKFNVLKAQWREGLKARNDSTQSIEARETNLLFYGKDFPANRLPTGTSLEEISREDLIAFHKKYVHPGNFAVAASGALKRADLLAALETGMANWPEGGVTPPAPPKIRETAKPGVYTFHKEGKNINQGRVTIGHRGFDIHHPDVAPMKIMNYIFGAGSFTARLMTKVRSEKGLAYSVYSSFRPGTDYPEVSRMVFQSKNESCTYAAQLCMQELERFRKEGATETEVKNAIQFFVDGFPGFFFSTSDQTATTFARAELLQYPKGYFQTWREKVAAVSVADVKRVANEMLHPDQFLFVFVGNVDAMAAGDELNKVSLDSFGKITAVPLPDPVTLERPVPGKK